MPQLDKVTWFSQIFWLLIILGFFYFFCLKYILPTIVSTLKLRSKVLKRLQGTLAEGTDDSFLLQKGNRIIISIGVSKKRVLKELTQRSAFFFKGLSFFLINGKKMKEVNVLFVERFTGIKANWRNITIKNLK